MACKMYGLRVLHISNSTSSSMVEDSQLLLLFEFDCLFLQLRWRLLWADLQTTWSAHNFIALFGSNQSRGGPSCKILIKFSTRLTPRAAQVSLFMNLSIKNDLSSFAVLTGKQNADSASIRVFLNSILHFSELKLQSEVHKQFVLEQFKKAIA